jgi:epoxyqueuosine reductase
MDRLYRYWVLSRGKETLRMSSVIDGLHKKLSQNGFKSTVVSVHRLPELRSGLEHLLEKGVLNCDFYDEITSCYDLEWNFEPPPDFQSPRSIILVATPQPKVRITCVLSGKAYHVIIPPTYLHDTDDIARGIVSRFLECDGYQIVDALLPEKLVAVRSGLACYGRNNISYIDGWGSFYRLKAFYSNMPCAVDHWQEAEMMEHCETCKACMKACPTSAIDGDRFLIRGERCLTFFNERTDGFPEWVDPEWHNCLIGCMVCQDVCPVNSDHKDWIVDGDEFSEDETRMILDGHPRDGLSSEMSEKLKRLYMWDHYRLLQRNLTVLINRRQNSNATSSYSE